jgi:hypothetical protein
VNVVTTTVIASRIICVGSLERVTAEPVPEALKLTRWCLSAPTRREVPTMPFSVIINAAKTVPRA